MAATSHVVLYGHDDMLQTTRRLLLERLGLTVSTADTVADLNRIYAESPAHLLIVCYTVEAEECDEVVAMTAAFEPGVKVALLSSIVDWSPSCEPVQKPARVVIEHPADFTRSIRNLLEQRDRGCEASLRPN